MKTLSVPAEMKADLLAFLQAEAIPLALDDDTPCVTVVAGEAGQPSNATTICAGGWIACGTALNMAPRLELTTRKLGALLNHLKVRIRHCSLGCFD